MYAYVITFRSVRLSVRLVCQTVSNGFTSWVKAGRMA